MVAATSYVCEESIHKQCNNVVICIKVSSDVMYMDLVRKEFLSNSRN